MHGTLVIAHIILLPSMGKVRGIQNGLSLLLVRLDLGF